MVSIILYTNSSIMIDECRTLLLPVSTDARVVHNLVVIHSSLALLHEPVLLTVGPDAGCSHNRFLEVRVDGGTSDRLQTL